MDEGKGVDSIANLQEWWRGLDPRFQNWIRWLVGVGLTALLAYLCLGISQ